MLLWSTRVASPHCDCVFYVCKGGLAALPGSGFLDRSADNTLPPCLFNALGRELTSGFCRMRKRHLKRGSLLALEPGACSISAGTTSTAWATENTGVLPGPRLSSCVPDVARASSVVLAGAVVCQFTSLVGTREPRQSHVRDFLWSSNNS